MAGDSACDVNNIFSHNGLVLVVVTSVLLMTFSNMPLKSICCGQMWLNAIFVPGCCVPGGVALWVVGETNVACERN